MLLFFRNFFSSTLGIAVTLGFVGLIALAFAAGDVAGIGNFSGGAGGDRVATVGNQQIGTSDLAKALTQNLDQARQQNPALTMKAYVAGGGLDASLEQLVDRAAIGVFGAKYGIVAGKRLVDSELTKIPGLQGLDGKFSDATYRQMLAQRQLTDAGVRTSIAQSLIAREALRPAQYGAVIPAGVVMKYAQVLKERRIGAIALVPAAAFAPTAAPSDAALAAFYAGHRGLFVRPETRVLRYVIFGDNVVKSAAPPTDAEIAANYAANQAQYAASQSRQITQLVAPTQAAAQAIADEVGAGKAGGKTLEAVAKSKGLSAAPLGTVAQSALADQSSPEVAAAAFAGRRGALVGPVKGPLGWHLLRIDAVTDKPARSLEQARVEIAAKLTADKHRAALADITTKLDDKLGQGYALTDAAKDLGLPLQSTPPVTADGRVFNAPTATLPKELAPLFKTAFTMDQPHLPQLAEVEAGKTYVAYDVDQITPSAPAPLAQIKGDVAAAMALEQGYAGAQRAALKLLGDVRKGADLATAMNGLGVKLAPPSPVSLSREQLSAMGQKVPAPVSLLFAMAPRTIKLLAAPRNQGWIVVQLQQIQTDAVAPNDPLLATAATELGQMTGNEYTEEMAAAMRAEVVVTRNPAAIKAVATQVVGGN